MADSQRPSAPSSARAGTELELNVRGLDLAAVEYGDSDEDTPILALHGWLDNAASFERLAPLLAPRRVLAVDLPGHGRSSHRAPWETYHFVDWVTLVFDIADARGWSRFHLLGHSMGAGIACLAAAALPERVARVVLLDGLGPLSSSAQDAPDRLRRFLRQRATPPPQKQYSDHAAAAARLQMAMPPLTADSARRLVLRGCRPVNNATIDRAAGGALEWSSDVRLRQVSATRFTEAQVRAFLAQVTAPTLVVRALDGYSFDQRLMSARLACLQAHSYVEVAGGHHVHLDAPETVASHVCDWFPTAA